MYTMGTVRSKSDAEVLMSEDLMLSISHRFKEEPSATLGPALCLGFPQKE